MLLITKGSIDGKPVLNWGAQMGYWDRDFGTPSLITLLAGAPTVNAARTHNNRIIAMNTANDAGGGVNWPATEETATTVAFTPIPSPW